VIDFNQLSRWQSTVKLGCKDLFSIIFNVILETDDIGHFSFIY
jgi:hypothetical protein